MNSSRMVSSVGVAGLMGLALVGGCASTRLGIARASTPDVNLQVVQFDPATSTTLPIQIAQADGTSGKPDPSHDSAKALDTPGDTTNPVDNYSTAIALLKKNYYGTPIDAKKTQQLTYEAVRGMLFSLRDQFTSFLDPDEWNQMQATTQGDFEGIGAILSPENHDTRVVEPIEGGPAEKAGIKSDDIITRVDGKPVIGKELSDVVKLIKGPRGTKVRIGIVRGKQTLEFVITRARVEPQVVKYWMEDPTNKIGHIVLKEFNEKSIYQMNRAFADLERQGMKALVFDLRYNPGGLLKTALDVASVFIPQGTKPQLEDVVVHTREGNGHETKLTLRDVDSAYTHPVPLAVLVNENSASAAEIASSAIKDYGVGTIIGERTYGKGRVQTLFPLDDGSALRLTTQLYFPPSHYDLNFKRDEDGNRIPNTGGVLPDIEVKQSDKWKAEDFKDKTNDTQLQKALDFLRLRLKGQTVAQATQQVAVKK